MLLEALTFFLTPTSPVAKKYGFLYQSIALQQRYNRCKKAWLPHLKNCQDLFFEAVKDLSQTESVVVLGSSHLHEIPLHLLMDTFKQVILVDVIHPLKHHWYAKRYPRLKLVTQDLSATLDKLESLESLNDLDFLIDQLKQQKIFHFEADLIVSGNLLSQLGLLPIEAVEKKLKRILTIQEKDKICTAFAELHLKNLQNCSGKKVVYADREVIYRNPEKEIIYQGQYSVDFTEFTQVKKWTWLLAPLKEASQEYSIEMNIEAYKA